jgi:uncharacterized protein (TIGR00106 family)
VRVYVIAEFSVLPIGVGVSLSKYVAVCEKVLQERALRHEMHANGTNIEGDWSEVMMAIYECHVRLHDMGVPRISTSIRISTRTDRTQTMSQKIESVREKIVME